jgi:NAD(P)-dependent dehydrogenase (short-subunit alcohol dehydrogenase family)
MKRFEKRTLVTTGASRGIGKGMARRFAEEGASLLLAANEANVDAVAAVDNITVNAFRPGIIETDMRACNDAAWGRLPGNYKPGELRQEGVRNIPVKRAVKTENVAGLISFLASEDAAYITGQTINVDGELIMSQLC